MALGVVTLGVAGAAAYFSWPYLFKSDPVRVARVNKSDTAPGENRANPPQRKEKPFAVDPTSPIPPVKPPAEKGPEVIVRGDSAPPFFLGPKPEPAPTPDPPTKPEPPTKPPPGPKPEPRPEPTPEPAKPLEPETAPVPSGKLVVKRRRNTTEEDLRREIEKAPEVALDRTADRADSREMLRIARQAHDLNKPLDGGPMFVMLKQNERLDLAGLPMRMGDTCKIGAAAADHLQGGSVTLRAHLFDAANTTATRLGSGVSGDTRPDPQYLHDALLKADDRFNKWLKPEAIPALQQLLMAENESIRDVLVDQLAHIEGPKATVALAQRAIFDLNPEVRRTALEALRSRPTADYQQVLMDGFRYPWPAVADHAAEAVVALRLTMTVPKLIGLLDFPDPSVPQVKTPNGPSVVMEMVRINHLHNCLLCHAPAYSTDDKVRGFVPETNRALPPAFTRAYYAPKVEGTFVRADVTYLQQDFSVPLMVQNPGLWPPAQRYDFLVRERLAGPSDVQRAREKAGTISDQEKAVTFALRELTGQDPGPSAEDWKRFYFRAGKLERLTAGLKTAAGVAVTTNGQAFVCDTRANSILKLDADGRPSTLAKGAYGWTGLALDGKGRLLACQTVTGHLVAVDSSSGRTEVLAAGYKGQPFQAPTYLATDRNGGTYLSDPMAGEKVAVYYVSAQGTVTRLALGTVQPRGVALSSDEKTLFLATAGSNSIRSYPLESAGVPGPGRVLCNLDAGPGDAVGGNGMVCDSRGNLYVCHPSRKAVQVINAEGAKLALLALPEPPLHCCVGGENGKTLFVTTTTGLYTIRVDGVAVPVTMR